MWTELLRNFLEQSARSNSLQRIEREFNALLVGDKQLDYAESLVRKHPKIFRWERSVCEEPNRKDDEKSLRYRQEGNRLHKEGKYVEALNSYNKSICFAASDGNVAIGYSNRSAVLFEMGRFEDCLENIRMAESFKDFPEHLKKRLSRRAAQCVERRVGLETEGVLQGSELSYKAHAKVPFIVDRLDVRREDQNSLIYAKEYLEPGKVVMKVKSFDVLHRPEEVKIHCDYCHEASANLIPCRKCTAVMFCGERCLRQATDEFHKWECPVMDLLSIFDKYLLFSLEMVLKMIHNSDGILPLAKYFNDHVDWFKIDKGKYGDADHLAAFNLLLLGGPQQLLRAEIRLLPMTIGVAFLKQEVLKHSDLKKLFETEQQRILFGRLLFHVLLTTIASPLCVVSGTSGFDFGIHYMNAYSVVKELKVSQEPNIAVEWHDHHLLYKTVRPIAKGEYLSVPLLERETEGAKRIMEELGQLFLLNMIVNL